MPALGFAVVALVLAPLLALVVRRRWWLASERQAEVMRLALLAAEEAQRAEEETLQLGQGRPVPNAIGGGPRSVVCAVCHSPTTTRCSRCKAVKYCSGKCQIIHWRHGHKNECFPPRVSDHSTGQVDVTKLKRKTDKVSELCNDSVNGDVIYQEVVMTPPNNLSSNSSSSAEAFSEDECMDSSTTESTSDSSLDFLSSSYSMFPGPFGSLDNTSSADDTSLHQKTETGKHLSTEVEKCQVEEVGHHPLGSKLIQSERPKFEHSKDGVHENIIVGSSVPQNATLLDLTDSKINKDNQHNHLDIKSHMQTPSKPRDEAMLSQTKAIYEKRSLGSGVAQTVSTTQMESFSDLTESKINKANQHNHLDGKSHVQTASKPHDEVMLSQTKTIYEKKSSRSSFSEVSQTVSTSRIESFGESTPPDGSKSYSGQLLKSKSLMYLPPASVDQLSRVCHFAPDDNTLAPMKLHRNARTDSSDIKASIQKVVQQFNFSKVSKQRRPSFENELPKKTKMLFPYERFAKLYSFDKVVVCPPGLMNCNNSCYANAVLQSLVFTQPLAAYLLQGLHSRACLKRDWCFTCELEKLLINAKLGHSPLSPAGILSHIHKMGSLLGHGREEDAHEFLRYAVDEMQSICLKEVRALAVNRCAEETTLIHLTFGGYLQSKIECMKCHNKSEQLECMMDLIVEIEGNVGTLEEALRKFTTTEILDGENKYKCPRCKCYERAKKKLAIADAPNILTIVLKRFQSGKFGKLNKAVCFPEHLNLAPYMSGSTDKPPGYKLYAVVVHLDVMNAAFSGHYVCYVKNRQGKWYMADDTRVRPVELQQVLSENAYMLLYARCVPHCPSLLGGTFSSDQVASSRSRAKVLCSGLDRDKTSSNAVTVSLDLPVGHDRHHSNSEPRNLMNEMYHFADTDSASDSSSLFSYSDEGSCSTESTRNSTSTDEYSDYIFGNLDRHNWHSPSRFSNDMNVMGNSSEVVVDRAWDQGRAQCLHGGGSPFLFPYITDQFTELTDSRSRETGGISSSKSSLLRSFTTRERTNQSYY